MKTKILFFLITLLPFTFMAVNDNPHGKTTSKISVSPITTHRGDTAVLVISLSNPDETYNGFQMDLQLPEGISLCNNRRSGYQFTLSDRVRKAQPSVVIKEQKTGLFRILLFSFNQPPIIGNSGPIITLSIITDANMKKGKYHGTLSNIIFNKKDNKGANMEDVEIEFKVKK